MSINDNVLTKDLTEEEYRIKYLKYKEKYIALKNQSGGLTFNCNRAYEDAGWTSPPCQLCINSKNPIGKCCMGFKSGTLRHGFKAMFKKGKQLSSADAICNCGHPASKHLVEATRPSVQEDLIDILAILGKQADRGDTKENQKASKQTAKTGQTYADVRKARQALPSQRSPRSASPNESEQGFQNLDDLV